MPDPTRAFSTYRTGSPPWPSDMAIGTETERDAMPGQPPIGHCYMNTDDDGPDFSNGTAWFYPKAATDGWIAN